MTVSLGVGLGVGVVVGAGVGGAVAVGVGVDVASRVGVLVGAGVAVAVGSRGGTVGSPVVSVSGLSQATAATIRRANSPAMMPMVETPVRCLNPNLLHELLGVVNRRNYAPQYLQMV